jgi:RNA polymerase sigma-70 factor (ECF subfamily)
MAASSSNDEVRLVLLAQTDDRDAIEALFLGVQGELLRYISALVGYESAKDVLQDVFVKIWRNLPWLERAELFRPWAYRIASRTCLQFLKRERRSMEYLDPEPEIENLPSGITTGPSELIGGLENFVGALSPARRAVLLLHYGQDLPIEDVAAILHISPGTAKSRLAYGLACLRKTTGKER